MAKSFPVRALKVMVIFLMMASASILYATDPKEDQKNKNQEDQQQVEASQPGNEVNANDATENESRKEEEGVSISNLSFNFIFYLIYKIKYAEILKLPTHKRENSSSSIWSIVSINELIQKVTRTDI